MTESKKERFIKECATFCKAVGLKTKKDIYDWLVADLTKEHKGSKWEIKMLAEDYTEGICLKLNIRQKGIRK